MIKFTPGPWHVGMKPGPMVYGPQGEQIVGINVLLDQPEVIANARLIAAAPELLEALKQFVDYYESMQGHKDNSVIRNGKAAINKAEGREG